MPKIQSLIRKKRRDFIWTNKKLPTNHMMKFEFEKMRQNDYDEK